MIQSNVKVYRKKHEFQMTRFAHDFCVVLEHFPQALSVTQCASDAIFIRSRAETKTLIYHAASHAYVMNMCSHVKFMWFFCKDLLCTITKTSGE